MLESMTSHDVELDPETNKVNVESIKPILWSEEAVAAYLAKRDKDKQQKTDDDPTKEQMVKIYEEQLREIHKNMGKMTKEGAAGAAESNDSFFSTALSRFLYSIV